MMFEKVTDERVPYLSIAGGFVWNRKSDKTHPDYAEQNYGRPDGTTGTRSGAKYKAITCFVKDVVFKTHKQYGESINISIENGGDKFIIAVSTNNRYSQDLMKMLLTIDLTKAVYMKPFDFIDNVKKRATGISFLQDGKKVILKNDGAPFREKDWFKEANKKQVKRFFEDLNEWYVSEVEEKVCPFFNQGKPSVKNEALEVEAEKTNEVEQISEKTEPVTDLDKQLDSLMD